MLLHRLGRHTTPGTVGVYQHVEALQQIALLEQLGVILLQLRVLLKELCAVAGQRASSQHCYLAG